MKNDLISADRLIRHEVARDGCDLLIGGSDEDQLRVGRRLGLATLMKNQWWDDVPG
jgi:hypothetical protein